MTGGDQDSDAGRKRDRVAAGSDDDGSAAGDTNDYDGGEETANYDSGEEYYFDDCNEDDEPEVPTDDVSDCMTVARRRPPYAVLTEDEVRRRQDEATAKVAEVLSLPPGFAAAVLRHFKWNTTRVEDQWFSDDRRVRDAVGLPVDSGGGAPVPTALSAAESSCAICFAGPYPAGETRSAGCRAHFYCADCWRGYIAAAVDSGARCLSLGCPDPSCAAAVVGELVDATAAAADRDRYARFALRSFVEESGGGIKWCPAPGCTHAVELAGGADGDGAATAATDVFCACRRGFCWGCGEEAHRPVSCGTVAAWLEKNRSFSETANWLLPNTKQCPSCHRPMEKNQGCRHMTCPPPCGHKFCWVCLDPWNMHMGCKAFRQDGDDEEEDPNHGGDALQEEEELCRRLANASDRYLYHYERWVANHSSLEEVFKDMAELESSEIKRIAAMVDLPETEFEFLTRAYEQIADGRRVLKWAYAYGYYLDPARDAAKRGLFDHLLDQANSWLEKLHAAAELERRETFCSSAEPGVVCEVLNGYYKGNVENLTGVTRTFLGNLVKAFETTDLPKLSH